MYKVFLFSTRRPHEVETYWDPYQYLKLAFENGKFEYCSLVETPESADLILVCPSVSFKNPVFPKEIFRDGVIRKYGKKCVVLGVNDEALITYKGFYTSLVASKNHSKLLRGGVYLHVVYAPPYEAFPLDLDFDYLFSFLGSFANHPIRQELGSLSEIFKTLFSRLEIKSDFMIRDTSQLQEELKAGGQAEIIFRDTYQDSLKKSKFILCPRGGCPSSVRVFETMKASRVPVVISDEWVPPPEIPWSTFVVYIKERDINQIPKILKGEESSFIERATAARQAWDDYLAAEVFPITITRWGMSLIETRQNTHHYGHLWQLAKQLLTWRFIRQGVISELHGLLEGR